MSRRPFASFALLVLAACGDSSEPAKPATPPMPASETNDFTRDGAAGARAVVEAYFVAAHVRDEAAMLALGTPQWREKEKTWKKGFTRAIVKDEFRPKSHETREPVIEGDVAQVSVRATFVVDGKDDGEGMNFTLKREGGRWWITELR